MAGSARRCNTGGVGRGDTVAVFGCGGVGDAAIAGARSPGARTIIAVDIDDRKLELGQGVRRHPHRRLVGKDRPGRGDPALTGGNGADVCIEAVGRPETYEQAFYARDLAGTVVLVGVPTPT
jgi:S-(hydroxymethyl)mycothiol dehydrogenase